MMDIVLNGRAFVDGRLTETSIGIRDGRIARIGGSMRSDKVIDAGRRIILPGSIDPHVHLRDPGMTDKEDFQTGTMAALHAGVTCVLDMPNTVPAVTSISSLDSKKSIVSGRSYVDYGLFAALTQDADVKAMASGAAGFKLFMGSTTGDILMEDPHVIGRKVMEALDTGRTVSVHAEDNAMIGKGEEKGNRDHLRNRPADAEISAIRKLERFRGRRVNICHVTSAEAADLARRMGFTTEATAHHLLLECRDDDDADMKVNPPLRPARTRDALFAAFRDGRISMIGSDHAPHTRSEKTSGYARAPSGISCVETTVPMMMYLVHTGTMPLGAMVRMVSETPAETFGMNKGRIATGYDADIIMIDMDDVRKIRGDELHGKTRFSVYEGYDAIFPDMVMVRGNIQIENGGFCGYAIGKDIRG